VRWKIRQADFANQTLRTMPVPLSAPASTPRRLVEAHNHALASPAVAYRVEHAVGGVLPLAAM
jgi:hypothetical protein